MYYNIYDNIPGEWKLGPMAWMQPTQPQKY